MKKRPTNIAESVRQRLLNHSRKSSEDFNSLLTRFAIERLLYRIGVSSLSDQFYLKGAHLFAAWTGQLHRPTRDVDFLGFGSPLPEDVANRFRQILAETANCEETRDGLTFDADTMEAAEIREEQDYGGVRVKLRAHLAGARMLLTIDVGFGDAVTPAPIQLEFPTLLDDPALPSPTLSVYPVPSVIAEKTEALTSLGIGNSRLKDFYDLWMISRTFEPKAEECVLAIRQTFERRKTTIEMEPLALTEEFWTDADVLKRWTSFAKKNLEGKGKDFSKEAMLTDLQQFLLPVLKWAAESVSIQGTWEKDKRS
ncbi:MAG: nucleotidyl transferase AbiEii/AbiGii toxin family protein, partial [Verrucomicrobiota bacterium]